MSDSNASNHAGDTCDHGDVKRLFAEASERPTEERDAFVDRAAAGNQQLARRVKALLALDERVAGAEDGQGFMGAPTGGGLDERARASSGTANAAPQLGGRANGADMAAAGPQLGEQNAEGPGTILGAYRLLQRIGEGGFGTVFMAEQEVPVRRRVALKIIKLGMDTRQVVARFEQERQALALMDHPHIAKVFDGGATATGRPFFVMELCTGEPITTYCDAHGLTIRERLEVVEQVCRAVQHAHQKGVVHRDLKPSNILVSTQDGRPFVKVIDFGIAKATSARLVERTLFTEHRQLIGTPEYMSPEQAEGSLDIDTRTDVYSLGVLLYELLTGSTPFDPRRLRSAAYAELQRIIREVDPPAPSTRLSESRDRIADIAARRRSEPRKLGALVRNELDWIVMKALEKDRSRRYESASSLAEDLGRFLAGEAVRAAPVSRWYRLRTFVRRHRGAVVASGLVVVALLAGVIGTSYGMVKADRERREATISRSEAEIITAFLSDMLDAPTPDTRGRDVSMRSVLDAASSTIPDRLDGYPIAEARLRRTVGNAYRSLGEYERASDHLREALEIRSRLLGPHHEDTIRAKADLAGLRQEQGNYPEAERLGREALAAWTGDPDSMLVMGIRNNLAQTYVRQGRSSEALAMLREVVDAMRRVRGSTHNDTIGVSVNLAGMLERHGQLADAEALLKRVTDDATQSLGVDHPTTLFSVTELAGFYLSQGRPREAEPLYRDAVERKRRVLGPKHSDLGRTLANYGLVLAQLGRPHEGRPLQEEAWRVLEAALGPYHHDTIEVVIDFLEGLEGDGWPDDVAARVPAVIDTLKRVVSEDRVDDDVLNTCAWFLLTVEPVALRDPPIARRAAERCCAQARVNGNPLLWSYLDTLALAQARNSAFGEAVATQREAITLLPASEEKYRGEMTARLREYEAAAQAPALNE